MHIVIFPLILDLGLGTKQGKQNQNGAELGHCKVFLGSNLGNFGSYTKILVAHLFSRVHVLP